MKRQYNRRTMERRDFVRLAGLGLAAGASAAEVPLEAVQAAPSRTALMKVGTQHGDTDDILRVMAGFGVNHICSRLPSARLDDQWSVEALTRLRERVESFGLSLDLVPLPLSSNEIEKFENPNIMLGKSPERDREIDDICQMIRNTSRAGIPGLKYNLTFLGVVRSAPTPGRGGAEYSTFVYDQAKQDPPLTKAGPVSADAYWERITYFLERVIPVAEEYKVRMAFHPQDPAMPADKGFRGVHTVLGSVDGLKRFIAIAPSTYHGLNFCQGTVAEMLKKPGEDLQRALPKHPRRIPELPGNIHRRWRCGHAEGDAGLQRGGVRRHDDARSRAGDRGGRKKFSGVRYARLGYIKALIAAVSAEA